MPKRYKITDQMIQAYCKQMEYTLVNIGRIAFMYTRSSESDPRGFSEHALLKAAAARSNLTNWPDEGTPCGHRGCLAHITHPCEGCGRVAGYHVEVKDEEQTEL